MSLAATLEDRFADWDQYATPTSLSYVTVLLSVLLVTECVYFLRVPAATSYEPSLKAALPLGFWALFYCVLVGGICLILFALLTDTDYWYHGVALVLANYAILLFLPKARGYKLYGRGKADLLRHLGDVKGILGTGSLPGVWYPGEHVLMAELGMLGIPLDTVPYVTAFLFTALTALGMALLAGAVSERRGMVVAGSAAAMPLVFTTFHISNHPAFLSFMLVPALLAAFERYRRTGRDGYLALFVLFGVFVVYAHPMTTVFATAMVGVASLYSVVYNRFVDGGSPTLSPRLVVVLPVLLFAWLVNFDRTQGTVLKLLASSQEATPGARTTQRAVEISFTPLQLASKFLNLYGTILLYFTVAGLVVAAAVVVLRRRDVDYGLGMAAAQFCVGSAVLVAFTTANIIVASIVRASRYALLFAVVLVAFAVLGSVLRRNGLVTTAVALLVVGTAVVGANAVYEPNRHLTYAEYDGTEFLLRHNQGEDIHSADTTHKMEEYVLGTTYPNLWPGDLSENSVPPDLGYTNDSATAADTYGDAMLVTKAYDREQHTAPYFTEDQQAFLFLYGDEEMARLRQDRTANKVYANGGLEGWDVNSSV